MLHSFSKIFFKHNNGQGISFILLFLLTSSFLLGRDSFFLGLTNKGDRTLYQQIVSYPLSETPNLNPKVLEIREGKSVEIASQYNKGENKLLFLLPGFTKPGDTRRFQILLGEKSSAKTDIKLIETDDYIIISNTYFLVKHRKKGGGGFPEGITFNISGNKERFIFEDRLYEKNQGYFTLRGDANSSLRVISHGPLEIILEAKAQYFSDHYAPGNARATYRYIYRAYSPYIEVSAKVEKDDDFTWSELHFLQISRKDNTFSLWAGGEPFQQGRFTDSRQGKMLGKWAIMFNAEDAIGLYTEKGISLFDGISEYYNYIQEAVSSFGEKERSLHAWLYLGPVPEDIEKTFQPIEKEAKMEINPLPVEQPSYHTASHTMENGAMAIGFASEEEGLGLVSVINKLTRTTFLRVPSEEKPLIWRIIFSQAGKNNLAIDNTTPSQRSFQIKRTSSGWECQLQWKNIDLAEEKGVVDVSVKVKLPEKSRLSFWRISVDNRSKIFGLWEIHFPLFAPLGKSGEVDVAVPRSNWGYLYRGLNSAISGYYPSCDWPMQFLSINMGDGGLYLACYDPEAWTKSFSYTPGAQFFFNIRAENMGVAGSDFASFPIAVGTYRGNWLTACKLYREWALENAPWTQKGPLTTRRDTPKSIKELGLWMLGGGTKDEVVPNMLKAQEFFQVPLGIHWYNWHQIGFDTEYPNYFPYKPGFPQGVKELTSRNILAMPYINGRLWDSALDSFKKEAITWCAKQVNGEPYIEVYNPRVKHAVMCPYTKFWQDKVNEIVERLIKECGVDAIYIDQIGAAGSVLCFDKNHGHPLGGGGYWVSGYRELLRRVKEKAAGKVAITTENNTECYMDGVDAFLIWNPRNPSEIPMMTAVYSGYTIYFSSPTHGFSDTLSFRMIQGRDFIWGCQLGWMGFELLSPEHKEKAEFLKLLAKYRMATLKYIIYGELLGEITPLNSVPTVHGTWFNWGGGTFKAELPAVMGTLWKGSDGTIGALIVNVSDSQQVFSFSFPKELLPKGKKVLINEISPQGKQLFISANDSNIKIILSPSSVRVLEFQPVASKEKTKLPPIYQLISSTGLEWELDSDRKEVAEGEEYNLIFRAKSKKPIKLNFYLDGATYELTLDGKKETKLVIPRIAPSKPQILIQKGIIRINGYQLEATASLDVLPRFTLSLSSDALRAGETATLIAKIKNNSALPQSARLFLQTPSGAKIFPAHSLQFDIPGNDESEFIFQISLPSDFPTTELKLKAYISDEASVLLLKVLPPPPSAFCPYVSSKVNLQQALMENPPIVLKREGMKISQWKGEDDLSAIAWLGWDHDNFYFLIDVKDDVFHQPFRGKDIWQGDCIQIAFRPSGVANNPTYDGVYEFGLALTLEGEEVYQWVLKEGKNNSAFCRITRKGNTTRYELALPWKEIGVINPAIGLELGWAFTVNENDGKGFRGWWEWAGGICGTKDASLFGKLILTNRKGG